MKAFLTDGKSYFLGYCSMGKPEFTKKLNKAKSFEDLELAIKEQIKLRKMNKVYVIRTRKEIENYEC